MWAATPWRSTPPPVDLPAPPQWRRCRAFFWSQKRTRMFPGIWPSRAGRAKHSARLFGLLSTQQSLPLPEPEEQVQGVGRLCCARLPASQAWRRGGCNEAPLAHRLSGKGASRPQSPAHEASTRAQVPLPYAVSLRSKNARAFSKKSLSTIAWPKRATILVWKPSTFSQRSSHVGTSLPS